MQGAKIEVGREGFVSMEALKKGCFEKRSTHAAFGWLLCFIE